VKCRRRGVGLHWSRRCYPGVSQKVSAQSSAKASAGADVPVPAPGVEPPAAMGGFGFSLTELPDHAGIVAYWQQRSGGLIVRKARGGIESISVAGSPAEFRNKAKAIIGAPVDLWLGEEKVRRVISTRDGLDAKGRPRFRILVHDDGSHALQWVQRSEGSFAASASIDLKPGNRGKPAAGKPILNDIGPSESKAKRILTTFRLLFNAPLERIPIMFEHSRHDERNSCILWS
jgi:hypothetical protein